MVRAIRGAITVKENTTEEIIRGTKDLLNQAIKANDLKQDDMISIIFSVTEDLNAAFPAVAAREIGLTDVPLICTNEINVPESLKKCIRFLMHVETDKAKSEIKHVYLEGAKVLRPDLT